MATIEKLWLYAHCPFCMRVEVALGALGIKVEKEIVQYDDAETPTKMIGKKMLPILEYTINGEKKYMGESMDIVKFLDSQSTGKKLSPIEKAREEKILEWLFKDFSPKNGYLYWPRVANKVRLPEMTTDSGLAYWVNKHDSKSDIKFLAENEQRTKDVLASLNVFEEKILLSETAANGKDIGYEDVLIVPFLMHLTLVKGFPYPAKTKAYIDNMVKATGHATLKQWES
mmetsp:Transcript_10864/g.11943  ORF Transcript_10864/g.11943 Transcript_10864/m.11943 type:complete len:228 (+) Transcript_10864:21-704(+)